MYVTGGKFADNINIGIGKLNNLFSHCFNIEFNKDKHDYNTRCKIISVRVHLVGTGGIGPRQILP